MMTAAKADGSGLYRFLGRLQIEVRAIHTEMPDCLVDCVRMTRFSIILEEKG